MTDRAVSTVVSYVLMLGIVALVVSALIGAFAPFVDNQRQAAAQSTLEVYGNDVAGDIDSVDRLATDVGENGTVSLRTSLPDRVAGSRYEIEIVELDGENAYEVVLDPVDFDARTTVTVRTQTPVQPRTGSSALDGGDVRIVYDPDENDPDETDKVVIRNA